MRWGDASVPARRGGFTFACISLVFALTNAAQAEDRAAVLDAPAPPTLPALAHPGPVYTFELTTASLVPRVDGAVRGRAYAWFSHNELEMPLVPRKWYLGVAHDIAAGSVPGVGNRIFLGNPEIWGRGLWSSVVGLSSGVGLGLVMPIPRHPSATDVEVLQAVRVVRPWDDAYFADRALTFRPWFDIRHVTGRFILQFRQGLDVVLNLRPLSSKSEHPSPGSAPGEHRSDFVARATFYLGYRATETIGLGLEVWEVYQVSADISDDRRASVSLSPSIRFALGRVAPAISILLPVTTPLRGEAASYFAARFNIGFQFDPHTGKPKGPGG